MRTFLLAGLLPAATAVPLARPASEPASLVVAQNSKGWKDTADALDQRLLSTNSSGIDHAPHVKAGNPIVFGMQTGSEVILERALPKLRTWCASMHDACVVFSDAPDATVQPIVLDGHALGLPASYVNHVDKYYLAQKRFMPALYILHRMIDFNYRGRFAKTGWAMLVDDDTYVFHKGLMHVLGMLPSPFETVLYAGMPSPKQWFPVFKDGGGNDVGVQTMTPFVLGGGGSIFSIEALKKIDLVGCIQNTMPDGPWAKHLSDWALGLCAELNHVPITSFSVAGGKVGQPFNQFACVDEELNSARWCQVDHSQDGDDWSEDRVTHVKIAAKEADVVATLHPIKLANQTYFLHNVFEKLVEQPSQGILDILHKELIMLNAIGAPQSEVLSLQSEVSSLEQTKAKHPRVAGSIDTGFMYCKACPKMFATKELTAPNSSRAAA